MPDNTTLRVVLQVPGLSPATFFVCQLTDLTWRTTEVIDEAQLFLATLSYYGGKIHATLGPSSFLPNVASGAWDIRIVEVRLK